MKTTHFKNGRIFTSTADGTLHDSLVIAGDKVVFVGTASDATSHSPSEVVDLEGKVVLPGIIDAHSHLMLLGGSLTKVDCLGKSIPQIQAAIKERYESDSNASTVLGCQFQYDAIVELPHKKYLDEVCPDKPCIIDNSSLHSVWLNSAAMSAMGITNDTPNPKGGEFVRDEAGELTGYFRETAVVDYVWPWVAAQTSLAQRESMLGRVFDAYLATGVTGAVDLATVPDDLAALEAYAAHHGRLPIRIACHWLIRPNGTDESRAAQVLEAAAHRDRLSHLAPWLSVAGIKIISDGVVDSCTAFLRDPYPNGETPGPIWPGDELQKVITLADSLDLQVACHAIGDAAVDQALDAFEAAIEANGPRERRRHRIEHLELVGADAIPRLARLGVVASMQPVHADPVKVVNWDAQLAHGCRCDRKFPWKEFEDANADVAFGSDAPTAPYHPLPNLYTATTRLSAINPSLPDPVDERTKSLAKLCVSLETAVRYYTAGGAYSMRADKEIGTLEPGKSADFAVLAIDPFDGRLDSLRKAQKGVAETWVAGQKVWTKGA
ncbi:uncharacterized protein CcaverHIS019_0107380 [Cutaneotrichosporon cavernicola]|uniref:Amidohydrolase 3 domain-containing protein n=1 Tax=Cutaneotrichosporon cavernicola TaxID=279322 RepID=A0AA48I6L2_9TREE|nr:uncharacterized protein CcaverHIS019_0107380 [Cutaneotrichosporon cavernicola]BEI88020.1 hypothetical protein CcaverHIS019_0107380 [Cutaneotrichosporon cavernicola]BEI95794.1 hypothetical protein CcaverHIS631_0107430 [Cutaneotrichosporon cavernicola]BEJ03567.1 hypothetical protein CcaverHIS641_0107420 [Cutaneotrichosporon cavernicola]